MEQQWQFLGREHNRGSARAKPALERLVEGRCPPHPLWAKTVLAFGSVEGSDDGLQSRDGSLRRRSPTTQPDLNAPASSRSFIASRQWLIAARGGCWGRGRFRVAEPEVVQEVHGQADQLRDEDFVSVETAELVQALSSALLPAGVWRHRDLDHSVACLSECLSGGGERVRGGSAERVDVFAP